MATKIIVDPEQLTKAAQLMESQVSDYQTLYKQLFDTVEGLSSAWQGADNVAFATQVSGFLEDFQTMEQLMLEYTEFLKKAAETYTSTQNDIVSAAKNLAN